MPKLVLQWRFFKPTRARNNSKDIERRIKKKLMALQVQKKAAPWQYWAGRWHFWCDVSKRWRDQYGDKLYRRKVIWVEYDATMAQ